MRTEARTLRKVPPSNPSNQISIKSMTTIREKGTTYEVELEDGKTIICSTKQRALKKSKEYGDLCTFVPLEGKERAILR